MSETHSQSKCYISEKYTWPKAKYVHRNESTPNDPVKIFFLLQLNGRNDRQVDKLRKNILNLILFILLLHHMVKSLINEREYFQVKRMLRNIYSPNHIYYIHVDKRQKYMRHRMFPKGDSYLSIFFSRNAKSCCPTSQRVHGSIRPQHDLGRSFSAYHGSR